MSAQLDITEAKDRWDELLSRARGGEEILLADKGKPIAKLGPIAQAMRKSRVFGEFTGKIRMADDFQSPLSGSELQEWEK